MTKKYVIEGGPCSGKSKTLERIHDCGIYVMKEVAEYLIERGITPAKSGRDYFQKRLLETQLEWESEIPHEIEISFQDSGIPRGLAYYKLDGLQAPPQLIRAAQETNYDKIFWLDPLQDYENTRIRIEDQETSLKIHRLMKEAYEELGYKLVQIPKASLEYRTKLILDLIRFEHDAMKQPEMETIGGKNEIYS